MIVLVRHGETEGNRQRVLQVANTPLNAQGLRQAALLAARLRELPLELVLCSDMPRARMTAQPILEATGAPVEYSPLLQERNFGELRGTPYASLSFDPFAEGYQPPGGESWDSFHERVAQAFAFVVERRQGLAGNLLVVTHGLMCRAIVGRHAQVARPELVPGRFDNTSVTLLGARVPHATTLINCCAHLRGDERALSPADGPA